MENKNLKLIIMAAVALLVGLSLLSTLVSESGKYINKDTTAATLFDVSTAIGEECVVNASKPLYPITAPTDWRATYAGCTINDILSTGSYTNQTGEAMALGVDYTINSAGYILLNNTAHTRASICDPSVMYINNYQTCPATYLNSKIGQDSLKYAVGFFALALFAIAIGICYKVFKDEGYSI